MKVERKTVKLNQKLYFEKMEVEVYGVVLGPGIENKVIFFIFFM